MTTQFVRVLRKATICLADTPWLIHTAGWDYRSTSYARPRHKKHPHDVSVMTYRGHAVLKTLIRCHFSPIASTDQRYVYSGSADGKIHVSFEETSPT